MSGQVKKSKNSYSLLLKELTDAEKTKPPKKQAPLKRPSSPEESCEKDENSDPDVPDRSYGDYYCKMCDSHMNSDSMWEAHITGKRHIKNVKKGETESRYEDLPNEESAIKYELKDVKDPIVGLSYIHEIRRKEPNVPPIYNCFLCHASIATVPLVIEHVISFKHRLNYIREKDPEECKVIEGTNLSKGSMEPLIIEKVTKMEQALGRGTVQVKQEKKKDPVWTYSAKKSFKMDDDSFSDTCQQPFNKNLRDDDVSVWKSVGTGNNFGRRERSRSPRNFDDRYISPPRSPRDFRERKRQYSDEHSMDDYKSSFSKRNISPPRRLQSPPPRRLQSPPPRRLQSPPPRRLQSPPPRRLQSPPPRRLQSPPPRRLQSPPPRRLQSPPPRRLQSPSPRRQHSPRRELSPKYDYDHLRDSVAYQHFSKKSDSHDRMDYFSARYERTDNQDSRKRAFDGREHQQSVSFMPQDSCMSSSERSIVEHPRNPMPNQPRSIESLLEGIYSLSSNECYTLFYQRLKSLPDLQNVTELLSLTKLIHEAQKKLQRKLSDELLAAIINYQKTDASNIPGLGDAMVSSTKPVNITTANSPKPVIDPTTFLNDLFSSANSALNTIQSQNKLYQLQTSFTSSMSSQQSTPANTYKVPASTHQAVPATYQAAPATYQAAPATYQVPPATYQAGAYQAPPATSFYDAKAPSYPDQVPHQVPNKNVPFPSSSMPNFPHNNTAAGKTSSQGQIFNYSQYTSTPFPSASKNFSHKY